MDRRKFLQFSALFPAFGIKSPFRTIAGSKKLKKIGVQLFSLPFLLEKDFRGTMKMLAEMGYKEIEMYGPYPFSTRSAVDRWNSITPSLGFSGSGYFGHDQQDVRDILQEAGLSAPSIHIDLETLETRMEEVGEAARVLGHRYAGIAAIPEELRKDLDGYKRMADRFNRIGEKAKEAGLKFLYHNHGYGLQEMDGEIPMKLILERTDPDLVFLELDIYWTTAAGAAPAEYLKTYPGRYHLMHIKDMKEKVRFAGDGGNPAQWIELFPYMASAGDGVLGLPEILEAAVRSGVKHYIVEQDMVDNPGIALKRSIDYLKTIS